MQTVKLVCRKVPLSFPVIAPGQPNLEGNWFASLAVSPKAKKQKFDRTTEFFAELPATKKDNPKYIVISAVNPEKKITEYSCFAVHRSLKLITEDILSVSELRDGNLLLLVKDKKKPKNLLKPKNCAGYAQ